MNFTTFTQQLAAVRERAELLRNQASGAYANHTGWLAEAIGELSGAIAELQLAERELRQEAEELRRSRDEVEAERERYRALFEFAPDGYLVTDTAGLILEANWAAGILLNIPEEILAGRSLSQFVASEEGGRFQAELKRMDQVDGVREWETRLQPHECSVFDASVTVVPERNTAGQVVTLRWLVRDITARKQAAEQVKALNTELELRVHERTAQLEAANRDLQAQVEERRRAEAALHSTNEALQALIHASPLAIVSLDCESRVQTWSPAAEQLFGWSAAEVLGQLPPYIPEEQRADFLATHQRELRGEARLATELQRVRADGTPVEVNVWSAPLRDAQGSITGTMRVYIDISERKRAEEALRESQARLSAIIGSAMDAIITVDRDQRIVLFNAAAERMFRCSATSVVGQSLDRFIPAELRKLHQEHIDRFGQTGITSRQMGTLGTLSAVRSDGERFPIEAAISQTRAFGQNFYTVILRDISSRKVAEEAIRARARQQAAVAELGQLALTGTGVAHLMKKTVALVAETLGVEMCKVLELLPDAQTLVMRAGNGWAPNAEAVLVPASSDTQAGYTLQSKTAVIVEDLRNESRFSGPAVLHDHGVVSGISIVIHGQDRPFGVLGAHSTRPQKFTADDANFLTAVANVLSAAIQRSRAEAEIRALNTNLERRVAERTAELEAKNRELEAFTYSVSHDLKAPLRGVEGYSRILVEEYASQLDPEAQNCLTTIRGAVAQMNQLIDDLLAYSRVERRTPAPGPVDLRDLINTVVAERADELRSRGVRVTVDIPCEVVSADPEGLAQAVRNLLDNSLKFTYGIPDPHIEISGRETEDSCVLWVRDNGIGFDMQYHDRIFGIFQRLHRAEDYPGTGIGLAIVHKAVRRMNGRVWAESAEGQGACFYLELPKRGE